MKTATVCIAMLMAAFALPCYAGSCGDGVLDQCERCDDGNTSPGDGCSQLCLLECQSDADCAPGLICDYNLCLSPCTQHCDCPQGEFCYHGRCACDAKVPVFCCEEPFCPPGRSCFDAAGIGGRCAEDPEYFCESACDCGPAHCCNNNTCVKDLDDPWLPGGTKVGPSCIQGVDATYCCSDPTCHPGWLGYGGSAEDFRCHDLGTGQADAYCGGTPCYSTCDCEPGESCIDTHASPPLPAGRICRYEGGFCVSNAVAEAVYGSSPSDLNPCCGSGCLPGVRCVVGWRTDGEYAAVPIVGVCGGVCGNGFCDPGESPSGCPNDCGTSCGDGKCFPEEMPGCSADCLAVSPCPVPPPNYGFQMCGDGVCQQTGYIPEDCINCWQDCDAIIDADSDGTPDGCEFCPDDPLKVEPGVCGCGVSDEDADSDGTPDCNDNCPSDPLKIEPGQCGCGVADDDADGDGSADCIDTCPLDPNDDSDGDGLCGDVDECPESNLAPVVVIDGCASGVANRLLSGGCTISDLIADCAAAASNHGNFVSCVALLTNDLVSRGLISGAEKGAIEACAAHAAIP